VTCPAVNDHNEHCVEPAGHAGAHNVKHRLTNGLIMRFHWFDKKGTR